MLDIYTYLVLDIYTYLVLPAHSVTPHNEYRTIIVVLVVAIVTLLIILAFNVQYSRYLDDMNTSVDVDTNDKLSSSSFSIKTSTNAVKRKH